METKTSTIEPCMLCESEKAESKLDVISGGNLMTSEVVRSDCSKGGIYPSSEAPIPGSLMTQRKDEAITAYATAEAHMRRNCEGRCTSLVLCTKYQLDFEDQEYLRTYNIYGSPKIVFAPLKFKGDWVNIKMIDAARVIRRIQKMEDSEVSKGYGISENFKKLLQSEYLIDGFLGEYWKNLLNKSLDMERTLKILALVSLKSVTNTFPQFSSVKTTGNILKYLKYFRHVYKFLLYKGEFPNLTNIGNYSYGKNVITSYVELAGSKDPWARYLCEWLTPMVAASAPSGKTYSESDFLSDFYSGMKEMDPATEKYLQATGVLKDDKVIPPDSKILAFSPDGKFIVVQFPSDGVFYSNNFGAEFSKFIELDVRSDDGKCILIRNTDQSVHLSTDGGKIYQKVWKKGQQEEEKETAVKATKFLDSSFWKGLPKESFVEVARSEEVGFMALSVFSRGVYFTENYGADFFEYVGGKIVSRDGKCVLQTTPTGLVSVSSDWGKTFKRA